MYYDSNSFGGTRRLPTYPVETLPMEHITAQPMSAGAVPGNTAAAPRPVDPMAARMSAAAVPPTAGQRLARGMSVAAAENPGVSAEREAIRAWGSGIRGGPLPAGGLGAAARGLGEGALAVSAANQANRLGAGYVDPALQAAGRYVAGSPPAQGLRKRLPDWANHGIDQAGQAWTDFGRGARIMAHLATGGDPAELGQFFTADRGGSTAPAANPTGATSGAQTSPTPPPAIPGAAPPNPASPGTPVDLGQIAGNGQPPPYPHSPVLNRPALPGAALTPTPLPQGEGSLPASTDPAGRIMGLDRVQPGQGFASMEQAPSVSAARQRMGIQEGPGAGLPASADMGGGPVRYEIGEGGQVRKFGADGREQAMRGGVSILPGDRTADTAEQEVAHAQGMQRLRQGLPYDPKEFATLQQQQQQAGREDTLWRAATGPLSTHQSVANFGAAGRKQKLAGAILGQELGGQRATDLATQKAMAEWYMAQAKGSQDYQREIAKADRAGQWNVEQERAKVQPDQWATVMQQTDQGEVPYTYSKRSGRQLPGTAPQAAAGAPGAAPGTKAGDTSLPPGARRLLGTTQEGKTVYELEDGTPAIL